MMHINWRDCQAWKDEGLVLSSTSNEACKLYDAALTQYVSWKELSQFDGLGATIEKMLSEDSNFVMGHVIDIGLNLLNIPTMNKDMQIKLDNLNKLKEANKQTITDRELMHINALNVYSTGNIPSATNVWEQILIQYPTDLLALKFAHDAYFYLGYQAQMRDSIARVIPFWKASQPLYNYLYGMWSFGLVQTNFFNEAERAAKKSLELNKYDAWATHTICHLNEYQNTFDDGIKFLTETESDWSSCKLLSCHNYWHLCLYNLERNDKDAILQIYDEKILPSVKRSDAYLDIVDACSILYRLKLDDANYMERWLELKPLVMKHISDNGFLFNDLHIFMCISSCNDNDAKLDFIKQLNNYVSDANTNHEDYLKKLKLNTGVNLVQAINYFDQSEFSKCVELLYPIRYNLIQIGGSNAQRDLYHQMLTISALKSDDKLHKQIGIALLNERKGLKPNSNLTKRIATRFNAIHELN